MHESLWKVVEFRLRVHFPIYWEKIRMVVFIRKYFLQALSILFCLNISVEGHNTWWGPTGLIQVPTTTITRPNETSVSTYASIGGGDFYLGWNFNMAFSDHLELSVADTVGWDERSGSSTLLSMKFVPLENVAVGGLFDTNDNYQHTIYTMIGSPQNSVYLGLGLNFGNGDASKAVLGNYSKRSEDMETLFVMAGARWDLSKYCPSLEGIIEYNGDTMSLGFGYIPETNWDVQLDYMTSGDLLPDNQLVLSVGTKF